MTTATLETTKMHRILCQGHTKPFTEPAFIYKYMMEIAQPIMQDFQGDMYHDCLWLYEHVQLRGIQPNEVFTFHWYVSDSHTTIHHKAEPYRAYGDKLHYMFTLFLASDGWWTLNVAQVPAMSPL